jgi:hypothetical protein
MPWIVAYNEHHAASADELAIFADAFNAGAHFHDQTILNFADGKAHKTSLPAPHRRVTTRYRPLPMPFVPIQSD